MKQDASCFARSSSALAMAAALFAPPSPASDLVAVRAVAGLPQAGIAADRALVWRNVGVVAESDLVDVEAKIATCSSGPAEIPSGIDNAGATCNGPSGFAVDAGLGRQFRATLKIPRWHTDAPFVDLTLRSWRSTTALSNSHGRATGSAAELAVTHPLGPVDAYYGYSTPLASFGAQGIWRSAFAGLSWQAAQGTTLEFVADRGTETATGAIDRLLTLRILHAATARGIRFAAWTTRAVDDRADAIRVGIGLDYAF